MTAKQSNKINNFPLPDLKKYLKKHIHNIRFLKENRIKLNSIICELNLGNERYKSAENLFSVC